MILGYVVTGRLVVGLGLVLFTLLLFQLAIGMRWIKLGKRHRPVHRSVGITLVVLAAIHGLLGATLTLGLRIL